MRLRDEWFQGVVSELRSEYRGRHLDIPPVHVSFAPLKSIVGETYARFTSPDNINRIYISSDLASDTVKVITVLAHESIHAMLDCRGGHGREFVMLAKMAGLSRPFTQAVLGSDLRDRITGIRERLGDCPLDKQ